VKQSWVILSKRADIAQHFELLPEPSLLYAQSALLSEIQPEVTNLLSRVEAHLDKLDRREQGLMAKCELQEGRLLSANERGPSGKRPAKPAANSGIISAAKMQQAMQKKERLSYAIERLQLQAGQKERQLRKSLAVMAPPPPEEEDLDF
jgi:DASH complex subunit SPC19